MVEHLNVAQSDAFLDRAIKLMAMRERFPRSIFLKRPRAKAFFDYAYITSDILFELLKKLCTVTGDTGFVFLSISPDAKSYYYEHFNWIPAASFSRDDQSDDHARFVLHDPGESPADAIAYSVDEVAILSHSSSFIVYGTRASELGVIAILNEETNFLDWSAIEGKHPFLMGSELA